MQVITERDIHLTLHDGCDHETILERRIDTERYAQVTFTLSDAMLDDVIEVRDESGDNLLTTRYTVVANQACTPAELADSYCQTADGWCSTPADHDGCAAGDGGAGLLVGLFTLMIRLRRRA